MIARATKKARRAREDVHFQNALAEALPFPDGQFDVALATVMLHHLPCKPRQQFAAEVRRVLKPGGRILAVEFAGGTKQMKIGQCEQLGAMLPGSWHLPGSDCRLRTAPSPSPQ